MGVWGGDTGKAKAAGPEVKRGRGDLAEVLWQSSNPYKDGRSLGDQWLDAKGRQRVEGPEMRRGRKVCFPCSCTYRYIHCYRCTHTVCACNGCVKIMLNTRAQMEYLILGGYAADAAI